MKHVGQWLREMWDRLTEARTQWTVTDRHSRGFTEAERAAIDRAFAKFDEGFKEIDALFKDWRR